ncbi:Adenylyltransferase and sulfurtransferase MOCS3-2 [Gracilariopsis chorda]|uniref:Adenylyltransferase and sulfurtransferase MOCS3 homolog n=1 Tax=Gracilariopsis chorda TaxID=448386 RepID=A0A2V3J3H5_9FLOR|nr:Adenylyltransferase and sulfurtransferase MOCS3-2 [Gracilariopsis chorda]|eukprot:PXF49006.1 Adenylyltransferase and sulfurtransferase MOCS3-2 [Gracilariopsis chorda]
MNGDSNPSINASDVERYSRQLLIPQFGPSGQQKLEKSRVLVVGLGGLGCPAALYLAGAGVGTIGLVDRPNDVVEKSNLHRQLAHSEARIGTNKVASAAIAIQMLNSNVAIEKHESFEPKNAVQLASSYNLVLDCTDNVASRYLVSDACAVTKTPLLSGSAIGTDGQLTFYCKTADSPCYRCIFPKPPPSSCVGSCDSAGVLGPVPGVIGTLQALEAIKFLSCMNLTEDLDRRMLLFDGSTCTFRTVKIRSRVNGCDMCGESSQLEIPAFDYEGFARGGKSIDKKALDVPSHCRITPEEFAEIRRSGSSYKLIDVRPSQEFDMCHLDEAESWPLKSMEQSAGMDRIAEGTGRLIIVCRRGNASQTALRHFLDAGRTNVCDVIGGLQAWHQVIDNNFPLY